MFATHKFLVGNIAVPLPICNILFSNWYESLSWQRFYHR